METKSYKEAARAIRRMGRTCILERIEMIKRGESCPNDLLTHMLDFASMPFRINKIHHAELNPCTVYYNIF